jgi:hypothetical protein
MLCITSNTGAQTQLVVGLNNGNNETFALTDIQSIKFTSVALNSILSEEFNQDNPAWTKINNSTGGQFANAAWTTRPNNYVSPSQIPFTTADESAFILSDSDAQGAPINNTTNTLLISPPFSTTGYSLVYLQLNHHYEHDPDNPGPAAFIELSTDSINWTILGSFSALQGDIDNFANTSFVLPESYLNQPNVYLRFRYLENYGFWWAINKIGIKGITNNAMTVFTNNGSLTSWLISDIDQYSFTTPSATPYADNSHLIQLFPNPASDILNIEYQSEDIQHITIDILNINGLLVDELYCGVHRGKKNYQCTIKLTPGTYLCRIQNNKISHSVTKPFIIK